MNKKLFVFLLLPIYAFATNSSSILAADKAYTTGNLSKLSSIYVQNKNVRIIAYMYAKGMLTKNIAAPSESFIGAKHDDYMRIDLIHQLLIYYYKNNNFSNYLRMFKLLPLARANSNERCGYDLANFSLQKATDLLSSSSWLVSNSLPPWCADLMATRFKYHKIDANQRDYMLINLVLNKHTDTFNSLALLVGVSPINFYKYGNSKFSSTDSRYKFIIAYQLSNIARAQPERGEDIVDDSNLSSDIKSIMYGYVALQYSLKQDFKQSIKIYEKSNSDYLSNDELEWRTRSYLALEKWDKVSSSIDDMPEDLQTKNIWLYWNGKALAQLNKDSEAVASYKHIPNDYSYYSMLAKSELKQSVPFVTSHHESPLNSHSVYLTNATNAMDLYLLAQQNHRRNIANIVSTEWNYASRYATDAELVKMSMLARKNQLFDLSIAAADQMNVRDMNLSYPTPFLTSYKIHSRQNGIDPSYALGVTRQESRFNYKVIAFDGGVGLMQIMPETAKYIAHKSNSANCYKQTYDCNIKFGTWYLGNLYQKFNGNYLYATAAYNGGPNRARRWQDNLDNLDILMQMELIPINITRGYVQKVLSNKAIYDGELSGNNRVNLLQYLQKMPLKHYLQEPDDDHTDASKM